MSCMYIIKCEVCNGKPAVYFVYVHCVVFGGEYWETF